MNNNTSPPITAGDITIICTSVLTLLLSGLDLILNYYAHSKDRKVKIACSSCCTMDYQSSEEEHK